MNNIETELIGNEIQHLKPRRYSKLKDIGQAVLMAALIGGFVGTLILFAASSFPAPR